MKPEQKEGMPWWIKSVGGVAAMVLLVIGVLYFLGHAGTAKWNRYADRLRDGGMPLTFEEISAQQPPAPDGPTVASTILAMADDIDAVGEPKSDEFVWVFSRRTPTVDAFRGVPRYTIEPTRAYLTKHRAVLDELATLRDLPAGRFPPPTMDDALMYASPVFMQVRRADKLLRVQGLMNLLDGDLAGALADVRLQRRISEAIDQHPTTIGRLVQMAGDALMVKSIEDILRTRSLDASAISTLEEDVTSRLDAATMKWAMLGERAFMIAVFDDMAAGGTGSQDLIQGTGGVPNWIPMWLVRDNEMRAAEMLTWLVDAGDDPAALVKAADRIDVEMSKGPLSHFLLKMVMPSLHRACVLHLRCVAQLTAARCALAAERFRLATGRLPASFDELVPQYLDAVPADPFGGAPMRLVATDQGIVIYSIGENEYDDGGDLKLSQQMRFTPDVGIRLVGPEHRGIAILDVEPPSDD